MATIEGHAEDMDVELDVKRFYIPGIVLRDNCPRCQKTTEWDFSREYLSYPRLGKVFEHEMYCEDCNLNWPVSIRLTISMDLG